MTLFQIQRALPHARKRRPFTALMTDKRKTMKNTYIILLLFSFVSCTAQKQYSYQHPIPFQPKNYICYKTESPIKIDGQANEAAWHKAPWTDTFIDIEGDLKPIPEWDTKTKMLWDDTYFYVYAKMDEPHIWATLKNRDDIIFLDDDFEVFIDPDGDAHNYFELEINAFNTLWDLFMMWPYRQNIGTNNLFHWNINGIKTATHIEGTLNDPSDTDEYWTVEMAIPWDALIEMAPNKKKPKEGDQWRVNFSRVDWTMEIKNGKYQKVKGKNGKPLAEDNWVWSPQGYINLHAPEAWGYVQFSENMVGTKEVAFQKRKDEEIKWALWNLYFQQKEFYKKNKKYNSDISIFEIPETINCSFNPDLFTTPTMFEFIANSCEGNGTWHINQDGKIYLKK